MGDDRTVRLQLDVSERARRNLRTLAAMDQSTMSCVLNELLTKHLADIARRKFDGNLATFFEEKAVHIEPTRELVR